MLLQNDQEQVKYKSKCFSVMSNPNTEFCMQIYEYLEILHPTVNSITYLGFFLLLTLTIPKERWIFVDHFRECF